MTGTGDEPTHAQIDRSRMADGLPPLYVEEHLAEIERLTTQLALRDLACELGGAEVRRERARADQAERVIVEVANIVENANDDWTDDEGLPITPQSFRDVLPMPRRRRD